MIGRVTNLQIAIVAILASVTLIAFGRGTPATSGAEYEVRLTIVPSDISNLDCESGLPLNGERCAFEANNRIVDDEHALRPFVSTEGELVLLSNVFRAPSVAEWVRTAPADQRIEVYCRVRYVGLFRRVGVRFNANAGFETRTNVPAAHASGCGVGR